MSESDRSERVALVAVVCTVIIFVIGLLGGSYYATRQSQNEANAAYRNAEVSISGKTAESYATICQRPHEQNQGDLCQQWRMAEQTDRLTYVSELQAILSLVSVLGVIGAVWFAFNANRIADSHGKAQTKAYLSFKSGSFGITEYEYGLVRVVIQNVGNSPASDIKITGGFVRHTIPEELYAFKDGYADSMPPGSLKVIQLANFDTVAAKAGYPNSLPLEGKVAVILNFTGKDVFGDKIKMSIYLEQRVGELPRELNFDLEDHGEIVRGGLLDYPQ